jgi:outer membrane protein TolC
MYTRKIRGTVGIVTVFFILCSLYEPIISHAEDTVTLRSLIQEALRENPQIKSAKASWNASEAVPEQVSTLPDPMIMLGVKNIGSKYSVGTDPMSMIDFGFTQRVPFPGKLTLLGKMAGKTAEAVKEEYRAVVLNVIAGLKTAFFDYYYIEKSIETVNKTIELLKQLEKTAEIRYEVGKGIQQDLWKAQLEVSRLKERLEVLKQIEGSTIAVINSILNRPYDSVLGQPSDLELTEFNFNIENLQEMAIKNSPELKKTERLKEKNQYGLTLAKLQYLPDFSLTLGYGERNSLESMWTALVGIELPLYFWRRQNYAVREARANLVSSEEAYNNAKKILESEIKSTYLELTTSKKLIELYRDAIIPQAKGALESSMAGYAVGNVDFLTMVTNAITLLDYEIEYLKKFTDYEKAIAKLEALTGVQFATEVE